MNLNKHAEFFNPADVEAPIHLIGAGAVGSTVAEMLTRLGFSKFYIYDMDIVSPHNITNQMFRHKDIGINKCDAIVDICKEINPEVEIIIERKGYQQNETHRRLSGYVFLCADSIDLRNAIVDEYMFSPYVLAMFDFRMRLTDAQHYAADWTKESSRKFLKSTMAFTAAEAIAATPVSACGTSLSIAPTVRTLTSVGVANFINFLKTGELSKTMFIDPFHGILDAFKA